MGAGTRVQNSVKRGENPQIWYAICHSWAPRRVTIILQLWFSTQLICSVFLALTGQSLGVDNILVRAGCWLKRIVGIFATSFHLLLSIIFLLITSYRVRYKRFSIQFPYCSFRGYTFTIPNWREKSWINERRPVVTIQQNRPAVRFKNGNYYCWLMTAHVLKWYCYSWLGENTTI